jgi:hypothetical protein
MSDEKERDDEETSRDEVTAEEGKEAIKEVVRGVVKEVVEKVVEKVAKEVEEEQARAAAEPPTHAASIGVEPDEPPNVRIGVYIGILVVVLGISLVVLNQMFKSETRDLQQKKSLGLVDKILREQRAKDHKRLTTFDLVDPKVGLYQIPVERAMRKLLADPTLVTSPTGAAASQPASQPSSQPAVPPAPKGQP